MCSYCRVPSDRAGTVGETLPGLGLASDVLTGHASLDVPSWHKQYPLAHTRGQSWHTDVQFGRSVKFLSVERSCSSGPAGMPQTTHPSTLVYLREVAPRPTLTHRTTDVGMVAVAWAATTPGARRFGRRFTTAVAWWRQTSAATWASSQCLRHGLGCCEVSPVSRP